jgi:hypothetical protein
LQKILRELYIRPILKHIDGKTIDFGCGIGDLLRILPDGSMGLELNKHSVNYCKNIGLTVEYYNPEEDDYFFSNINKKDGFRTLVISHVLEHLIDAKYILPKLVSSAKRIGIKKIIIIVPGIRGFFSDPTHKIYIDKTFFLVNNYQKIDDYIIKFERYYPINVRIIGNMFKYQELWIIYENCVQN